MKIRVSILAAIAAGSLLAMPVWADRGHYGGGGHDHFWGPFSFLLGSAIIYSAVQPHPVYYAPPPPVVYAPPYGQPVYVAPAPVVQSYVEQPSAPPPPAPVAQNQAGDPAGGQWWYLCKNPSGYYPYVPRCPSGWERVSPTPPGNIRP